MQPLVTAAEMRQLEADTCAATGVASSQLMERAGRAAAEYVLRNARAAGEFAVLCGTGNNGGDGLVAARVFAQQGRQVRVYVFGDRETMTPAAAAMAAAYEQVAGAGDAIAWIADSAGLARHRNAISGAAVRLDSLVGIGLDRAIDGVVRSAIDLLTSSNGLTISIDVPSGVHPDTGAVLGTAVRADITLALGEAKLGTCVSPGFLHAGRVERVDIGLVALTSGRSTSAMYELADATASLPAVDALEHKGRRGHVTVVGGGAGMRGAARLAATAALRTGAGKVTIAWSDGLDGRTAEAPDAVMTSVDPLAIEGDVYLIGPGLGRGDGPRALTERLLASVGPAVIDADALFHLQARVTAALGGSGARVLTPHPKEAAGLLGIDLTEVEADRTGAARELARRSGAVIVLKGARTVICDPDGLHCTINPSGSPALATAGSGDVLGGSIAALMAQGTRAIDAARLAVFVHGRAGETLGGELGVRGVIASDLPLAIARELHQLREQRG